MPLGADGFLCPTAATTITLTADVDLTTFFAGQPLAEAYVRRITNPSGTVPITLVLSRVNDLYVTPSVNGGNAQTLQPGQHVDGCFSKIWIAGSSAGLNVLLEA